MENVVTLQDQLVRLSELIPIVVIGFFMGVASFFANHQGEERFKDIKVVVAGIFTSMILCVTIYAILGMFQMDYLVKIGVACAVSFFGIDKVLDILRSFVNAKAGRHDDLPPRR